MSTLGLHRTNDADTSIRAAHNVADKLSQVQQEVLNYAKSKGAQGFTDEALEKAFYGGVSTYRKRRTELTAKGLIVNSGRRREVYNPSNGRMRSMIIWVAAQFAERA